MIEVAMGARTLRVARYAAGERVEVAVGIADARAEMMMTAIADAIRVRVPDLPSLPTVVVRSRKRVARDPSRLAGAVAIVPVTARNARHLVGIVDATRAAGALGVQLVWDGVEPPRAVVERHVFAALEHARATPGEPSVVLAVRAELAPALAVLIACRQPPEPR